MNNKVKKNLNIMLIGSILIAFIIAAYMIRDKVHQFAISNSIDNARLMTKQLLATRHYLSQVVPDLNIELEGLSPFALAPAYVGTKVSEKLFLEDNFYIKQTSELYRNPNNSPDSFESAILKKYITKEIENEYYQIAKLKDKNHLRYTYPLYIEKACLACHGKPLVEVKKETYEALIQDYGDKSFNYKVGDFRGMISVAINIDDIDKTTNSIDKKMYIIFSVLFLIIVVLILLELKYIYNPQIARMKEKTEREKEDKEYLDTVIESNNNAIIAIDKDETILTYNKKAQEIFGFTKEEMIGYKNLLNIIPFKYKNLYTEASALYFQTGKSKGIIGSTLELEALTKDERVIPIRISLGKNNNFNKRIVVANIIDISKEKQQEKILRQQSRLAQMGEMISMIAHQWRQPLNAISLTSNNLQFKLSMDDVDKDFFKQEIALIDDYSQHLSNTIDDFRGFFDKDKTKEITNISILVENTLEIVKVSVENKDIKIITILNCHKELKTYTSEVKQVILNLIKNAEDILIENEIKQPLISIETICTKDDSHQLIIKDNAGGIPEDIIDKIFDPYFSTKLEKDGTGLGLYMSKTIIEEHCGGKLSVENDEYGAVFRMEFSAESIIDEK
ncbi:MAG: DUF3365 domain-containing protein [Helicobacteraceae bacterium]|nr:DUF3365 domain-containing protein [Helicobacteraceae bacterium]